ncbi:MAG: DUF488 family protein [Gemmatimonadota bacterium]
MIVTRPISQLVAGDYLVTRYQPRGGIPAGVRHVPEVAPSEALLRWAQAARDTAPYPCCRDAVWDGYRAAYRQEMRDAYRADPRPFEAVARDASRCNIVLVCYCPTDATDPAATRCHRVLLAEILAAIGRRLGLEIGVRHE